MKLFILLEKVLETEDVTVAEICLTRDAAIKAMDFLMSLFEETRGYKIEEKSFFG